MFGVSFGEVMVEIVCLVDKLLEGFSYVWLDMVY